MLELSKMQYFIKKLRNGLCHLESFVEILS
jgi:hypothetical protein